VFVFVCMVVRMVVCVIVCLDAMRMTFLSMGVLVARTVRMATWSVAVSDVVKQHETDNVRGKTHGSDDQDQLGLRHLLRLDESLNSFEEDGQTEGDQEDAVDESTERLCALPLHSVSIYLAAVKLMYLLRRCIS
jgi:hypothetical protein